MKTIQIDVSVSTGYVGSKVEDVLDIEIPEGATTEEIEQVCGEVYEQWVWDTINSGWSIKED